METGRKSFTVEASESISEEFSRLVEREGFKKWKATNGALLAYMALPETIRLFLNKEDTNPETARQFILDYFSNPHEKKSLETISPKDRQIISQFVSEQKKRG